MRLTNMIVLTFASWILSGCATGAQTDEAMKSWLDHNINELVTSWGPPESSVQLPGGNVIYTWTNRGSYTMPTQTTTTANVYGSGNSAYGTAQSTTTGGQTLHFVCQKSFTVSKTGRIVAYNWQGNNCR